MGRVVASARRMGSSVSKFARGTGGKAVAVAGAALAPVAASAQSAGGPDFTTLSSSVDFSTAVAAVMAVGAALVLVLVAARGARIVLSMISGR